MSDTSKQLHLLPEGRDEGGATLHRSQARTRMGFAESFHQDFRCEFPSVERGGEARIQQLSPGDQQLLISELAAFLTEHEASSDKALRNAWIKLGAQYWPRRARTKSILIAFLRQLREPQGI